MSDDNSADSDQKRLSAEQEFKEINALLEKAKHIVPDLDRLARLSPETASWRDLKEFAFHDGSRPFPVDDEGCFTLAQLNSKLKAAREGFALGGQLGDEGRVAMLMALGAIIEYLQRNLPFADLNHIEPLLGLVTTLEDLLSGATRIVMSGGNRHTRLAIELKARCVVMSELLQQRGFEKQAADDLVMRRTAKLAPLVGLKIKDEKNALENWRRDCRRSEGNRSSNKDLVEELQEVASAKMSSLVDSYLEATASLEGLQPETMMDAVLEQKPALTLEYLSHLAPSRTFPPD
jgi:hypothetical protein